MEKKKNSEATPDVRRIRLARSGLGLLRLGGQRVGARVLRLVVTTFIDMSSDDFFGSELAELVASARARFETSSSSSSPRSSAMLAAQRRIPPPVNAEDVYITKR